MSRKTSRDSDSTFTRLLGWTVVLALVFSAGMITGQRLIRHDSMPPLVSLSVSKEAQAAESGDRTRKRVPLKTTFSFYDHLSDAPARDELVAEDVISAPSEAARVAEAPRPDKPAETAEVAEKTEPTAAAEPAEQADARPKAKPETQPEGTSEASPEAEEKPAPETVEAADTVVVKAEEPSSLLDKVTRALGAEADEPSEASDVAGQFTIQVGNHVSKASAVRELARLRAMSMDAHMVAVEVSGKRFYRVRVGKYATDSDAHAQLETLGSKDINGMVVPL